MTVYYISVNVNRLFIISVNVNRLKDFEETKRHEMMMERQMMENVKRSGHEMTHIAVSINHHQHWAAVMSRGWAKASACRLLVSLSCAVLCQIVSLLYLSRSSLHSINNKL